MRKPAIAVAVGAFGMAAFVWLAANVPAWFALWCLAYCR